MDYFRPVEGIVAEVFTPPDDAPLEECFHADCAALFIPVPDGVAVEPGWTWDGTTLAPPPEPQSQDENASLAAQSNGDRA